MGKVIVIANRKGGCGKSMTAASLGVGLARQGKKTLIIDADSQHSDEPDEPAATIPVSPSSPPPVFVVNWNAAQYDFDLTLYKDHDIIGYDKDGVEHALGRSGKLTYVTSTGMLWGGNSVPGSIHEQISEYNRGRMTDEQVRDNYLSVLNTYRDYKAADLDEANGDLVDVLENGLMDGEAKEAVRVRRDYEIEIDLTVDIEQLGLLSEAPYHNRFAIGKKRVRV